MSKRVSGGLPHKIGTADISSAELKRVVMQFMENFNALDKRTKELERKVTEMDRR